MTEAMQSLIGHLAETRCNLKQMEKGREPELRKLLDDALRQLERALTRRPTVIITGEANSGKTSVANMLAGLDVLPAAVISNTAVPVLLRHGTSAAVSALTADGRQPVNLGAGQSMPDFLYGGLERIEVDLPSMRDHGYDILDTPSWADQDALIETADVLIWCSVAARPWTESERNSVSGLPHRFRSRSILIITHKDSLALGDRGRVFARYEDMAGPLFADILMVDAAKKHNCDLEPAEGIQISQGDGERMNESLEAVLEEYWNHRAATGRRLCQHISRLLKAALPAAETAKLAGALGRTESSDATLCKIAVRLAAV